MTEFSPIRHTEPSGPHRRNGEPSRFAEYTRTRDPQLRNELVLENERLVYYLAARFRPGGCIGAEDLVQVARLGLISAVERFDPEAGVSFAAFAVPTMVGMIQHCLRDQGWAVKIPRRARELAVRVRVLRDNAEQRLGRPPTVSEMAAAAGVDEEDILVAMAADAARHSCSLHAQAVVEGEERGEMFHDALAVEEPGYALLVERETVRSLLAQLAPRLQRIIEGRFLRELTQQKMASELGISQMHVSRLERMALRQLRELLGRSAERNAGGSVAPGVRY